MRKEIFRLCVLLLATLLAPSKVAAEFGDIVFVRKAQEGNEYPPATFPHFVHRMQFKCYVCHDAIFQMKAGANDVKMDAISNGKFCGTCHNETIAFGPTFESCQRCHK